MLPCRDQNVKTKKAGAVANSYKHFTNSSLHCYTQLIRFVVLKSVHVVESIVKGRGAWLGILKHQGGRGSGFQTLLCKSKHVVECMRVSEKSYK